MSSHREAPEISKDPVADGTDTYAFVSPDKPGTVTLIANFIPLQQPDGGPELLRVRRRRRLRHQDREQRQGKADIVYRFRFTTKIRNPKTFLYNTGPINEHRGHHLEPAAVLLGDPHRGRPHQGARFGPDLPAGQRRQAEHADYAKLAGQAVHTLGNRKVFAGQRADAFHVDLGSIFDLGALRPFN